MAVFATCVLQQFWFTFEMLKSNFFQAIEIFKSFDNADSKKIKNLV